MNNVINNKKAFTIIEFLIVIVILALLAAAVMPALSTVIGSARLSYAIQLVKNLNTVMIAKHDAESLSSTPHEAFMLLKNNGYDIDDPSVINQKYTIVWDMKTNLYAVIDSDGAVYYDKTTKLSEDIYLWRAYSEVPEIKDQKFSIYLCGSISSAEVTVGFDGGNNTDIDVLYTSDKNQTVFLYINGKSKVSAPYSTIHHYNTLSELKIDAGSISSYHEYGNVNYALLSKGKVVIEKDAYISKLHISDNEAIVILRSNYDNMLITKEPKVSEIKLQMPEQDYFCKSEFSLLFEEGTNPDIKFADSIYIDAIENEIICEVVNKLFDNIISIPSYPSDLQDETETPDKDLKMIHNEDELKEFFDPTNNNTVIAELCNDIKLSEFFSSSESDGVIEIQNDKHLNLNGYKLTINTNAAFGIKIISGGLIISDQSAEATGELAVISSFDAAELNSAIYLCNDTATFTLESGTISFINESSQGDYGKVILISDGIAEIKNGLIESKNTAVMTDCLYVQEGTVDINGGSFIANESNGSHAIKADGKSIVAVADGVFIGLTAVPTKSISGGKFKIKPSYDCLTDGMIFEFDDEYYIPVAGTYVAQINDRLYTSIEEAFNNCVSKSTKFEILSDVSELVIPAGKSIILLNRSISNVGKIINNGELTIKEFPLAKTEVINNNTIILSTQVGQLTNNEGASLRIIGDAVVDGDFQNNGTVKLIANGIFTGDFINKGSIESVRGGMYRDIDDLMPYIDITKYEIFVIFDNTYGSMSVIETIS